MKLDITLTEDEDDRGVVLAHRPDCPMVILHRIKGRPLVTMFGCDGPLPPEVKRHDCLIAKKEKNERAA